MYIIAEIDIFSFLFITFHFELVNFWLFFTLAWFSLGVSFLKITSHRIFCLRLIFRHMKGFDMIMQIFLQRKALSTLITKVSNILMYTLNMYIQNSLIKIDFVALIAIILNLLMNALDVSLQSLLGKKLLFTQITI